jgi:hypothetical protein
VVKKNGISDEVMNGILVEKKNGTLVKKLLILSNKILCNECNVINARAYMH